MRNSRLSWTLSLLAAAALSACGGGAGTDSSSATTLQSADAPSTVTLDVTVDAEDPSAGAQALPSFHIAAAALDEPVDGAEPHQSQAAAGVSTKGLTLDGLDADAVAALYASRRAAAAAAADGDGVADVVAARAAAARKRAGEDKGGGGKKKKGKKDDFKF